jgi:SNF2 family DNA or RNA helicase
MKQISMMGNNFRIEFSYSADIVDAVKQLPDRRFKKIEQWPDKPEVYWLVPKRYGAEVAAFAKEWDFYVDALSMEEIARQEKHIMVAPQIPPDWRMGKIKMGKRELFAHQVTGVQFLLDKGKAILADDMGLGKTTQALVAASVYQLPIIVVCPASLQENWRREARIVGVALTQVFTWAKFPESLAGEHPFKRGFVAIFDEAHYAQAGTKSQRGERFLKLCDEASAVFLLTGTPMKNGLPINIQPLLQAIEHPIVRNLSGFQKYYCDAKPTQWTRWDVRGAKHLDELHHNIKDRMLRRLKAECLDLPPFMRQMRQAEVTADSEAQYESKFKELRIRYMDRLSRGEIFDGAEALVMLTQLRQASSAAKIATTVELCEEIVEQGGQVVVFGAFNEPLAQIEQTLKSMDIYARYMQSAMNTTQRQALIDEFQAKKFDVFLSTFGTGGIGVNLYSAQTCILHDRPWTPADCDQAESRLHRYGQTGTVQSLWIQYGSVDNEIDDILKMKQERIELVMAGERKTMKGIESMHDLAMRVLPQIMDAE